MEPLDSQVSLELERIYRKLAEVRQKKKDLYSAIGKILQAEIYIDSLLNRESFEYNFILPSYTFYGLPYSKDGINVVRYKSLLEGNIGLFLLIYRRMYRYTAKICEVMFSGTAKKYMWWDNRKTHLEKFPGVKNFLTTNPDEWCSARFGANKMFIIQFPVTPIILASVKHNASGIVKYAMTHRGKLDRILVLLDQIQKAENALDDWIKFNKDRGFIEV
jgi:hypothetical protein